MLNSKYWKVIFPFQLLVLIIYLIDKERFLVWGQIDLSIFQIINAPFQAHSIRIFLVGGLIYLGELLGYSEIITFNFFVTILLLLNVRILYQIFKSYSSNKLFLFIILISPILIPFFQNGRGIITSFGLSLLFYSLVIMPQKVTNHFKIIINIFFSFLFLNVSSGAFLASVISFFFFFLFLKNKDNYLYKKRKIYSITLLTIASPILIIYLTKNIKYFDGSVIKMLNHGAGQVFNYLDFNILFPLLIILSILIIVIIIVFQKSKYLTDFYPFVVASFIGLLFGYSSFFTFVYINIIFTTLIFLILTNNKTRVVKL